MADLIVNGTIKEVTPVQSGTSKKVQHGKNKPL